MIIKDNMANMCAKVTSIYMEFTLAFGPKPEFSFSFKYSLGVHYGQGFFLGKPERAFGNISAESEEILERLNGRKNILFLDISGK